MNIREFFTGYGWGYICAHDTLMMSGDDIPGVLVEMAPAATGWHWPGSHWVSGRSCPLLYLARGPGMTLKIGRSGKPLARTRQFAAGRQAQVTTARLGTDSAAHRLLVVISKGNNLREKALLDLVAHERVSGEWSRGPDSELLISAICSKSTSCSNLESRAA